MVGHSNKCPCSIRELPELTILQEDDTYFNRARITSTLAYGNTVWVGTGEGNLIFYEILECAQLMTPTEQSPSMDTTSTVSYITRPDKCKGME